jgi:hypothetical protein
MTSLPRVLPGDLGKLPNFGAVDDAALGQKLNQAREHVERSLRKKFVAIFDFAPLSPYQAGRPLPRWLVSRGHLVPPVLASTWPREVVPQARGNARPFSFAFRAAWTSAAPSRGARNPRTCVTGHGGRPILTKATSMTFGIWMCVQALVELAAFALIFEYA